MNAAQFQPMQAFPAPAAPQQFAPQPQMPPQQFAQQPQQFAQQFAQQPQLPYQQVDPRLQQAAQTIADSTSALANRAEQAANKAGQFVGRAEQFANGSLQQAGQMASQGVGKLLSFTPVGMAIKGFKAALLVFLGVNLLILFLITFTSSVGIGWKILTGIGFFINIAAAVSLVGALTTITSLVGL